MDLGWESNHTSGRRHTGHTSQTNGLSIHGPKFSGSSPQPVVGGGAASPLPPPPLPVATLIFKTAEDEKIQMAAGIN